MPSTPQISLDIRLGGSSDPGWVNVKTANGSTYGYKYSGGDDGAGGLVQTVDRNGNSPRAGSIVDANTQVENAEYTVIVSDSQSGNVLIVCDPPVRNQPS